MPAANKRDVLRIKRVRGVVAFINGLLGQPHPSKIRRPSPYNLSSLYGPYLAATLNSLSLNKIEPNDDLK
jgi:hypothetical protein